MTFLKNYSYYNNPNSFCRQFLQVYKSLTGDRAIDKNEIFYAHGIYQPNLVRQKATSTHNGQSSFAVMTDSFIQPTPSNFSSLIVKNGSSQSDKIKQLLETTKSWLKTETITTEAAYSSVSSLDSETALNGVEAGLTPEPVSF